MGSGPHAFGFDAAWMFALGLVFIKYALLLPCWFYQSRRFWKLKDITFIESRRPNLVFALLSATVLYSCIVRTAITLLELWKIPAFPSVATYFLRGCGSLLLTTACGRVWLLAYDWNFCQHKIELDWLKHIKPESYIPWSYKYTILGNQFFVLFACISYPIFVLIVLFITYLTLPPHTTLFSIPKHVLLNETRLDIVINIPFLYHCYLFIIFLFCFSLLCVSYLQVSKSRDLLYFYLTTRHHILIFTLLFSTYTILMLFTHEHGILSALVMDAVILLFTFLGVTVGVFKVVSRGMLHYEQQQAARVSSPRRRKSSGNRFTSVNSLSKSKYSRFGLDNVLSHKDGVILLANFLSREYSVENLLFLLHYLKLKYELFHKTQDKIIDGMEHFGFNGTSGNSTNNPKFNPISPKLLKKYPLPNHRRKPSNSDSTQSKAPLHVIEDNHSRSPTPEIVDFDDPKTRKSSTCHVPSVITAGHGHGIASVQSGSVPDDLKAACENELSYERLYGHMLEDFIVLYEKYIASDAALKINLSYETQVQMIHYFEAYVVPHIDGVVKKATQSHQSIRLRKTSSVGLPVLDVISDSNKPLNTRKQPKRHLRRKETIPTDTATALQHLTVDIPGSGTPAGGTPSDGHKLQRPIIAPISIPIPTELDENEEIEYERIKPVSPFTDFEKSTNLNSITPIAHQNSHSELPSFNTLRIPTIHTVHSLSDITPSASVSPKIVGRDGTPSFEDYTDMEELGPLQEEKLEEEPPMDTALQTQKSNNALSLRDLLTSTGSLKRGKSLPTALRQISEREKSRTMSMSGSIFGYIPRMTTNDFYAPDVTTAERRMILLQDLVQFFDIAAKQIYNLLLSDSFTRFTRTPEFEHFVKFL